MSSTELAALVGRLESVTTRLEGMAQSGGAGGATQEVSSKSVEEFDNVMGGKFSKFFELSNAIGGDVAEQAALVKKAFNIEREILVAASKFSKPTPDVMKPLNFAVKETTEYCEKRRTSKVFNNLMTVKEGVGCVGWVTVSPKPAPYVKEMGDQALFYGNRVIKEFKGKDDKHVEWVRAFIGGISELQAYVKEYHTTGLVWNKSGTTMPPPGAGAPPPPPPPVVLPPTDTATKSTGGDGDSSKSAALFESLNKGADVTKGLKKVSKDQMTHKNPALRGSSVVKEGAIKRTVQAQTAAKTVKKAPKCELQNKKWVVENFEDNPNIKITDTNAKQVVYVFKCVKSTIRVEGKVNSIILDNCKRVSLCLDDVISSVEVINSSSIQVQILGKCQTVSIDKTDGCQVFLNKDCLGCEIFSAKSSEMNICVPSKDGDYSEHALPEQFKSAWNGQKFVTECSDMTA